MDLKGRTIAVTGASGFLGSYIALELLSVGATVKAVVRNPEKTKWLLDKGCILGKADLADRASLVEAFRGCDAIVANAALYTLGWAPWSAYLAANKDGAENVFDAAAEAGVKRIIDVSTCGVYKPWPGRITEDAPRLKASDRWWYANYPVSKAIAEDIAWERAAKHGLDLTVVRPAGIYGQRDFQAVPKFKYFMSFPILPAPGFRFPMSHGADVARGIRGALENDASIGKAYNLSGEPMAIGELLRTWKKVSGAGPVLVPLPMPFGVDFDNAAAKRDLGFSNRPVEDTIRDILAETP